MTNNKKEMLDKIKKATVAVAFRNEANAKQPFTIVGSGFCIDPSGIIITCRHVIDAFMERSIAQQMTDAAPSNRPDGLIPANPGNTLIPYALFYDIERSREQIFVALARAQNISARTDKDLAAIQLTPHTGFSQGYPYLEIEALENISEGDEIGVCGFPLGNYLADQLGTITSSFTKGILSSIIPGPSVTTELLDGFQLNVTATNGNSGGPVFPINSGKVFGVLTEGVVHPNGFIVQGLAKAEPVYPVVTSDFIRRLQDAPKTMLP